MPISFSRRFRAESEQVSLLVKASICGAAIIAAAYFVILYWMSRH